MTLGVRRECEAARMTSVSLQCLVDVYNTTKFGRHQSKPTIVKPLACRDRQGLRDKLPSEQNTMAHYPVFSHEISRRMPGSVSAGKATNALGKTTGTKTPIDIEVLGNTAVNQSGVTDMINKCRYLLGLPEVILIAQSNKLTCGHRDCSFKVPHQAHAFRIHEIVQAR